MARQKVSCCFLQIGRAQLSSPGQEGQIGRSESRPASFMSRAAVLAPENATSHPSFFSNTSLAASRATGILARPLAFQRAKVPLVSVPSVRAGEL